MEEDLEVVKPPTKFVMSVVSVDWVMSLPDKSFDICWSAFEGRPCYEVPVLRVFGATPFGQKCCLNLHKCMSTALCRF